MIRADVVHLPDGERWWYDGEIALDVRGDLWGAGWFLPGPWRPRATEHGLSIGHALVDGRGARREEPSVRGRAFPGWDAPEGARRSPWFWQRDGVAWWWDEGVLYRRREGMTWPLYTSSAPPLVSLGPAGAAVIDGRWIAGDRLRALTVEIDADRWVRHAGNNFFGLSGDRPVRIAADGTVWPCEGIPWGPERVWSPPPETPGPPALSGNVLAGPGGALWDLARGTRIAALAPGLVQALDAGFVIVPRAGGDITWVDRAGRPVAHGTLALGDELVTRLAPGPIAVTTDGGAWRLDPGGARPVERPRTLRRLAPTEGLPVEGVSDIGDTRWGWRTDGLLVRLTPSLRSG